MTAPILLSNGAWMKDLGNGATLEWHGCPSCLNPTPCPRWLGADVLSCEPYPCRCQDIDDDPPAWKRERAARTGDPTVYVCDPYVAKKGHWAGRWTNRCPCWGQRRDGMPDGCCSQHEHNPRYVELIPGTSMPKLATIPPSREAGWQAPHERVEDVRPTTAYADALGVPIDVEPDPYVRRWTHAELHCACRTPWDHLIDKNGKPLERGVGFHATCCHTNWRNSAIAAIHKRTITDPCRPPESIVDAERGVQILRARNEGGFTIWG